MQPCKHKNYCRSIRKENSGGCGRGILEFFCEKSRGPPTYWNGLMHDPSETPKQKHLILTPPTATYRRQK